MRAPAGPVAFATGDRVPREQLTAAPLRSLPRPSVLAAPLTKLRGAGPKLSAAAAEIGIESLGDLLRHLPRAYRDQADPIGLGELRLGEEATVRVEVRSARTRPDPPAAADDPRGEASPTRPELPPRFGSTAPGSPSGCAGHPAARPRQAREARLHRRRARAARHRGRGAAAGLHTTGIVPMHPASEKLRAQRIRDWVWQAIGFARDAVEPIPAGCAPGDASAGRGGRAGQLSLSRSRGRRRRGPPSPLLRRALPLPGRASEPARGAAARAPGLSPCRRRARSSSAGSRRCRSS